MNKNLQLLEQAASHAIRQALARYRIPDAMRDQLVRGILPDGEYTVFELYVPGERPADAVVVAVARVHNHTREVEVEIANLERI